MSQQKTTQTHYEAHSASSYESAYFYSPGAYTDYLTKLVQERLGLVRAGAEEEGRRVVLDVGGGTGNFTKMIIEHTKAEAIVIDPFLEFSSDLVDSKQLKFVKASAEDLGRDNKDWWRKDYQQVLMKEVIHHLDSKNRLPVFQGVFQDVKSIHPMKDPNILIITRPHIEIDYPLWKEARDVWRANQPSLEEIEADLKAAGFPRICHSIEAYPCAIALDRWQAMVRSRFWSTFSNFSDDELEQACARIAIEASSKIDDEGIIHFEDRLLFISAYKE